MVSPALRGFEVAGPGFADTVGYHTTVQMNRADPEDDARTAQSLPVIYERLQVEKARWIRADTASSTAPRVYEPLRHDHARRRNPEK